MTTVGVNGIVKNPIISGDFLSGSDSGFSSTGTAADDINVLNGFHKNVMDYVQRTDESILLNNDSKLDNNRSNLCKTIEKLRIVIPLASPSSCQSSSSDCNSPIRSKKIKKRYCYKCGIRYKHTAKLLAHLHSHVTMPAIKLNPIDVNNKYYQDYLKRIQNNNNNNDENSKNTENTDNQRKRKASVDSNGSGSLKIKLKITQNKLNEPVVEKATILNENAVKLSKPHKENTVRVLTASEIKSSPPRISCAPELPLNAMVSLANSSLNANETVHFECPPLDGLNQFVDDVVDDNSTAQLLKQLLENREIPQETEYENTSNEFISIDRLAHMCPVCNSNFSDADQFNNHKLFTGHGLPNLASVLEPLQEMTVGRPQQLKEHQHQRPTPPPPLQLAQQQSSPSQYRFQNFLLPPANYGQPPVEPLNHMSNQIRNLSNMPSIVKRSPPPLHRPPNIHANQPINMRPFMGMNPEMYHPRAGVSARDNNIIMTNNNPFASNNNLLANRIMPPMHQASHVPQHNMQPTASRFNFQGSRPPPPVYPFNRPPYAFQNSNEINNISHPIQGINNQLQQQRVDAQAQRLRNIDNGPIISMAPRSEGLPIIQSVQSGANSLSNSNILPSGQLPLNAKSKQLAKSSTESVLQAQQPCNTSNTNATNSNGFPFRGLTLKPSQQLMKPIQKSSETIKPICGSAEEAVQKLQLNSSVSIISKRKSSDQNDITIDLSKDDDKDENRNNNNTSASTSPTTMNKSKSLQNQQSIKCTIKKCNMRFLTPNSFRKHIQSQHRQAIQIHACNVCSAKFSTMDTLRKHRMENHTQANDKSLLGIPVIDLGNPSTREKLLSLGITNYIPVINNENGVRFGLPIISIDGPTNNNLVNLLGMDASKILPMNSMRQIPNQPEKKIIKEY